jgi:hypothetical protein
LICPKRAWHERIALVQTLMPGGRLGLVLHPHTDPSPVVEKLTSWARSHGKQLIADARDARASRTKWSR